MNYIYVALGSAIGGVARFIIGGWAQERFATAMRFPVGILVVNASGSFLIGILLVAMARRTGDSNLLHYLLIVGFCGGYTTFSTFSADTVTLVENGNGSLAALNIAASVLLALLATVAGLAVGRSILGRT